MRHPSRSASSTGIDPRVARTHAAVVDAATELLVEGGPNAVTVDAIVARSGVAKSTIYRHWESRDELLIAVIESCVPDFDPPEAALGFAAGLRQLAHAIRDVLVDPQWARIMPAMMVLKQHLVGIDALNERMGKHQQHLLDDLLDRGVAEGVLPGPLDSEHVAALVVGPMMFAALTNQLELSEAFCDEVVDTFLAAHARDVAPA